MLERVLGSTGAMVRSQGATYKAVAHLVLFYDSERWVVTREMLKVLEGFHHREARQITAMTAKRGSGPEWEYPSLVKAMETEGLHPIGLYIRKRKATIAEMVA